MYFGKRKSNRRADSGGICYNFNPFYRCRDPGGKTHKGEKQLKFILGQLEDGLARLVTAAFVDDDVEAVALKINELLEQIRQTIIKSNAASAALRASIADISHDMKTPLTSVIGYLQMAERECKDQKIRELLQICLERSRYCNMLMNDFFELSVLDAEGCTPEPETVDAAGILCEQILAGYPVFEDKGIVPHFEDPGRPIMVLADPGMLNRVIQNLISNGVKYTEGDIFFQICREEDRVVLTVSNPVSTYVDVAHIFDRFFTQDKSRSRGSGIGLYLCRQFTEAMGGAIRGELEDGLLSVEVTLKAADDAC